MTLNPRLLWKVEEIFSIIEECPLTERTSLIIEVVTQFAERYSPSYGETFLVQIDLAIEKLRGLRD